MLQLPGEPNQFRAAEQAAKRGQREAAYQLMCQALIENPRYLPAWLSISKLVDDPARQRACLERALALDPHTKAARDGIETLRLKELLAAVHAPTLIDREPTPRQLGAYLIEQRVISPEQLHDTLREQRQRRARGESIQFGDLLIERGLISPNTLARMLVAQLQEQIHLRLAGRRLALGNLLLRKQYLTPKTLQKVLDDQRAAFYSQMGD